MIAQGKAMPSRNARAASAPLTLKVFDFAKHNRNSVIEGLRRAIAKCNLDIDGAVIVLASGDELTDVIVAGRLLPRRNAHYLLAKAQHCILDCEG